MLQTKAPISKLRGSWQEYQGIPLMPTYHPAYLLRNPLGKREVWADMRLVLQRLRENDG
jgi:DNA polymerase